MALVRRSRGRDFHASEHSGSSLTTDAIAFYLPGLSRYINEYGGFTVVSTLLELLPLIEQTRWARRGIISCDMYLDCIDRLFNELSQCRSQHKVPDMKRPMETIRKLRPSDWDPLLVAFACYSDLLDKDCFDAPTRFRDSLDRYIIELLPLIATTLPLEISLNFVDLLESSHFSAGMKKLLEFISEGKKRRLKSSRGRVDLYLTGQSSTRIRDYVKKKLAMAEQEVIMPPFGLPVDFGPRQLRRLLEDEDESDDGFEHRGFGGGGRRGSRYNWFWDSPFGL